MSGADHRNAIELKRDRVPAIRLHLIGACCGDTMKMKRAQMKNSSQVVT